MPIQYAIRFARSPASEQSERDIIRGVQIQAGIVCMYICMCMGYMCVVEAHAMHTYVISVELCDGATNLLYLDAGCHKFHSV